MSETVPVAVDPALEMKPTTGAASTLTSAAYFLGFQQSVFPFSRERLGTGQIVINLQIGAAMADATRVDLRMSLENCIFDNCKVK